MGPATEEDIQVLTVRDGEGKTLQDARFVEILKSAKSRIKSASESLRGSSKFDPSSHNKLSLSWVQGPGGRPGQETGGGAGRSVTQVLMIWTCLRAPV